jgi:biotin transport system substrate-specific component
MPINTLTRVKLSERTKNILLVLTGSFILTIFSNSAIPLPFTPVPIVLQNFIAIALGLILGPKRALASVIIFLSEGALGLPVFSNFTGGIAIFLVPKGGYLLGYALSAFVAGKIFETKSKKRLIIAIFSALLCQYSLGLTQLSFFVGIKNTLALGFFPFIIGDILKASICYNLMNRKIVS